MEQKYNTPNCKFVSIMCSRVCVVTSFDDDDYTEKWTPEEEEDI